MKRLLARIAQLPYAVDAYNPTDSIQIVLKKAGKPVGGIYKDDEQEVRSPTLKQDNR